MLVPDFCWLVQEWLLDHGYNVKVSHSHNQDYVGNVCNFYFSDGFIGWAVNNEFKLPSSHGLPTGMSVPAEDSKLFEKIVEHIDALRARNKRLQQAREAQDREAL